MNRILVVIKFENFTQNIKQCIQKKLTHTTSPICTRVKAKEKRGNKTRWRSETDAGQGSPMGESCSNLCVVVRLANMSHI